MKIKFYLIILFSILLIFTNSACKKNYQQQISQIDSILTIIEKDSLTLSKFSAGIVKEKYHEYKTLFNEIDTLYDFSKKDSNWNLINSLANLEKPFRRHRTRFEKMNDDYSFIRKQLTDLQKDMKEKNYSKTDINKYLEIERDEANKFHLSVEKYSEMMQKQFDNLDEMTPKIKNLIEFIKQHPKKQKKNKNK